MKKQNLYLGLLLFTTLTGCEGFGMAEDCPNQGKVIFNRLWNDEDISGSHAGENHILIYNSGGVFVSKATFQADEQTFEITPGTYKALAFNNAPGVFFRGLEKQETAEAYLSISEKNGIWLMEQPEIFFLDNHVNFNSVTGKTNGCELHLNSVLKYIHFTFRVVKFNVENQVRWCKGTLSGLATRKMLYSGDILRTESATQLFQASPVKGLEDQTFEKGIYAFGFNEYISGQRSIKKILTVELTFEDQTIKQATLDLSKYFNDAPTQSELECTVDVIASVQNMELKVVEWNKSKK